MRSNHSRNKKLF